MLVKWSKKLLVNSYNEFNTMTLLISIVRGNLIIPLDVSGGEQKSKKRSWGHIPGRIVVLILSFFPKMELGSWTQN
jgi:hypothetical protein